MTDQQGQFGPIVRRLADIREERISWRSRGRLARGKLTLIDGDGGLGKSTMTMDWAARLSRGDALPDGEPHDERGVLLIGAEDDPSDTIRPRLRVMGADLERIYLMNEVKDQAGVRMIAFPQDAEVVEQAVRAWNIGLIVIDPVTAFLSEELKENSNQDVRRALNPLVLLSQRTGVSTIMLRHLNKSGNTNAMYRGGGSVAFLALSRIGLLVAEDRKQPGVRILAHTKGNIGPPPPSLAFRLEEVPGEDVARVEWLGVSDYRASDLLTDAITDDETRDENDEASEWLMALLADGPRAADEVYAEARKVGMGQRSLRRAKSKLKVESRKQGFQGEHVVWKWALPEKTRQQFLARQAEQQAVYASMTLAAAHPNGAVAF